MNKEKKDSHLEEEHCNCGQNCNCGDDCNCGEECSCNESCDCDENCDCGDEDMIGNIAKKYKEKEDEANKNLDLLQRTLAEFDNYKKRTVKEREMLYSSVIGDIIMSFIPVMDNFDKALEIKTEDIALKEGVSLIHKQFIDVLKQYNIEEIQTIGAKFDPALHEAVTHVDDANYGEQEILETFRKGYKIGDKVIRYAMVKVAN